MSAFVYVVHEPEKGRIKFGRSGDLARRLYAIRGWLKFDFLTSRRLRLSSSRAAISLETELKLTFLECKLICDPGERFYEGSGELYHDHCFYDVLAFLSTKRSSLCEGRAVEALPIEWRAQPAKDTCSRQHYQARGMLTPEELERRGFRGL